MRINNIYLKNSLVIFLTAFIAIAGTLTIIKDSVITGFGKETPFLEGRQFSLLMQTHLEYYRQHKSWAELKYNPRLLQQLQIQFRHKLTRQRDLQLNNLTEDELANENIGREPLNKEPSENRQPVNQNNRRPPPSLKEVIPPEQVQPEFPPPILLDAQKNLITGRMNPSSNNLKLKELILDGQVVGYIGFDFTHIRNFAKIGVERELNSIMPTIGLTMLLLSLFIAIPISYLLLKPIRRLTQVTHQIKQGQFDARVEIVSNDELGTLSKDFNEMASILEASRESRQRFIADISHEIRTPLSVIKSHLGAFVDGIRQPTPEAFQRIDKRVNDLNRLISDLYELSKYDIGALTYEKTPFCIVNYLNEMIESYRDDFAQKELTIELDIQLKQPFIIEADNERLSQLFGNIMVNSRRYTDAGGKTRITAYSKRHTLFFLFEDTYPNVKEEDLSKLFDQLYRAESSRNRATGGAGLGLSICKTIVEAHNGKISARNGELGGLRIKIALPI